MSALAVPIAKAGNATIEVDTDGLSDDMYKLVMMEGLKAVLNKRMSKVGSVTKLEGEEKTKAHEAAMKIANENLEQLRSGKIKTGRAASGPKVAGVVMTEARRLAKEVVKNTIKAAGMKVSHVEASEITKAANELIANDPSYVEQAQANIEARSKANPDNEGAAKELLAKLGGIHPSAKKVQADEKAKAERKSQLSSKQAGLVKPRAVPSQHAH